MSHITSPTALRLPVEEICNRARQAEILTIIDAAHSPGQIDIDLQAIGADFVFGNCHKWMLSPKGAGFLYTRKDRQALVKPLVVSWGYDPVTAPNTGSRFVDLLQWTGTHDPSAYLSVPASIQFMNENHWDDVRHECHDLLRQAIHQICSLTDMPPLYPLDSDIYHQMGIAPLPASIDHIYFKNWLYDTYKIELPLIYWQGNLFCRISVQGYNTPSDIEKLVEAMTVYLSNQPH
jgi:isopenicillin-N epimerase